MSDDDYHLGYYEGLRNCIQQLIECQMAGLNREDILAVLVAIRDEAKEEIEFSRFQQQLEISAIAEIYVDLKISALIVSRVL